MFCVQTSLCMRYSQEQFKKQYGQTVGLDFYLKRIILPGDSPMLLVLNSVIGPFTSFSYCFQFHFFSSLTQQHLPSVELELEVEVQL